MSKSDIVGQMAYKQAHYARSQGQPSTAQMIIDHALPMARVEEAAALWQLRGLICADRHDWRRACTDWTQAIAAYEAMESAPTLALAQTLNLLASAIELQDDTQAQTYRLRALAIYDRQLYRVLAHATYRLDWIATFIALGMLAERQGMLIQAYAYYTHAQAACRRVGIAPTHRFAQLLAAAWARLIPV